MSQLEARFNRRAGVGEHILNDGPLEFDSDEETPPHQLDQAEARLAELTRTPHKQTYWITGTGENGERR